MGTAGVTTRSRSLAGLPAESSSIAFRTEPPISMTSVVGAAGLDEPAEEAEAFAETPGTIAGIVLPVEGIAIAESRRNSLEASRPHSFPLH